MRTQILALAFLLAACGQPAPPAEETPPTAEAPVAPAGTPLSTGALGAMSNTAMAITGALTVAPEALRFEKGFTAATEFVGVVDATTDINSGGESFAEAAPGPVSLRVEVRRIIPEAPSQLCGLQTPATYVALASDEPLTALTLIVFSGAEAPGPQATDSAVCATFSYAVD
jgi:hypothetical protein